MTNEWDNTPWAGSVVPRRTAAPRLHRPVTVIEQKAVVAPNPWASGTPLSVIAPDPQQKAAVYLRAYKVGWFYKAGRKIATDIAALDWSVSDGDAEESESETTLPKPDLRTPFESLSPIDQFQRLLERPNPSQTGRALLYRTQVHLDFTGAACWFLDGGATGLPSAIYGINPARMTPARDKSGALIGWVMDKDSARPVPFETSEILWFSTGSVDGDDDVWGTSVVEAVYAQVPLSELAARHTANILTTGGRLAGMLWPKDRALTEDEFLDAQRAWRNVSSDPDAGKRLLIFPEPMEYAAGASTPAEIGIPELAELNRDEILTAFPVNPHMLGVPLATGMNSGETMRHVRREYWEGTIHPRADLLEETIQVGLLSRYEEATGATYDFELSEPNIDDAPALLERVAAFRALAAAGFDETESVKAAGLSHIKFNGIPMPEPTAAADNATNVVVADTSRQDRAQVSQTLTKALVDRADLMDPIRDDVQAALTAFLAEQRDRLIARIREAMPSPKAFARKALPDSWWDAAEEERLFRESLNALLVRIGRASGTLVANRLDRVVFPSHIEAITNAVLEMSGGRITDILETTREAVARELAEGVRRGYSISQLVDGVASEGFNGIANLTLDNGVSAFDSYRAEMIARTETAEAFNLANLTGYREFGVAEVSAIDGDDDADCADRNGRTYALDDALGISDHPNGTLDWVPITR